MGMEVKGGDWSGWSSWMSLDGKEEMRVNVLGGVGRIGGGFEQVGFLTFV